MNPPTLNDLYHRAEALTQDLLALRENEKPPPFVPKFKVGDRVRTKRGNVFTVDSLLDERMYSLVGSAGVFDEDELEPAPWTLSRHLPGFRPLEEGEQWHRDDFTEDMLPPGWRPLLKGEAEQREDEYFYGGEWLLNNEHEYYGTSAAHKDWMHHRTRRALPATLPDTERERFERAFAQFIPDPHPTNKEKAWAIWQAARKAQ